MKRVAAKPAASVKRGLCPRTIGAVALILIVMAGLMVGAMRQESATVDETTYLGAAYSFFKTGSYRLSEGHPILSQLMSSFPIMFFKVHESPVATAILTGQAEMPYTPLWGGGVGPTASLFPRGPEFYQWALPETQLFGQYLVYDPANDADAMLFACRCTQVVLTVLAGLFIFWWANRMAGEFAGLMALLLWAANPIVLAYGHLVLTDSSITLMIMVTLCLYGRFLQESSIKRTILAGVSIGLSFVMKFTALSLMPMLLIVTALYWWREKPAQMKTAVPWPKHLLKRLAWMALTAWGVVMVVYFPNWSSAPPIDLIRAKALEIPGWYLALRPFLIPKDFFKGLTVLIGHVRTEDNSYLLGEWSRTGWWYYYPLAISFKSAIPWLLATATALVLFLRRSRKVAFEQWLPWLGAFTYLAFAMNSKVDIGVRHVYPMYPLLAVGAGCALAQAPKKIQIGAWILCGWLVVVALVAYPFYIQYFNEFTGGPNNGYQYLIDSNFDWGQDAKRLKTFLDERHIEQIYLDYFGTQLSVEYLKIPNVRVDAEKARQIKQGWLVVSASELMHPEWAWLRESAKPEARVAYTLFVYKINGQTVPAQ